MRHNIRPTPDELFELLKKTKLPTVLVEGKNDIIFYRHIEEELREHNIDMLPAGSKHTVLELHARLKEETLTTPILFIVDKDIWAYDTKDQAPEGVITTFGYSIENDIYCDGDLESLLEKKELAAFKNEMETFIKWYAPSVFRALSGTHAAYRTHPSKVLDDPNFASSEKKLHPDESPSEDLRIKIQKEYKSILRGKSLLALLQRRLSDKKRFVKYSTQQLMEFGASRKGDNFIRLCKLIEESLNKKIA